MHHEGISVSGAVTTAPLCAHDLRTLKEGLEVTAAILQPLEGLTFEEIVSRAPATLSGLLSGTRLRVRWEHERPGDEKFVDGIVDHGEGIYSYEAHYVGPPELVHFSAYGFDDDPEIHLLLPLFFRRLLHILRKVGSQAELERHARRDWSTGLQSALRLQAALERLDPAGTIMALVALRAAPGIRQTAEEYEYQRELQFRSLAQALRLALHEEDQGFLIGPTTVAVLTPERERFRVESTARRLSRDLKFAHVLSSEAEARHLMDLLLSRLAGDSEAHSRHEICRSLPPVHSAKIYCGMRTLESAFKSVVGGWRFGVPVSIIVDSPPGFALQVLPTVERPVLVITDTLSPSYLNDLAELKFEGLVSGALDAKALQAKLKRMASGERVYEGPAVSRLRLFPREREVWRLIAHGLENQDIARKLGIAERTVANYFTSLKEKQRLSSRSSLALAYWGLSRPEQQ